MGAWAAAWAGLLLALLAGAAHAARLGPGGEGLGRAASSGGRQETYPEVLDADARVYVWREFLTPGAGKWASRGGGEAQLACRPRANQASPHTNPLLCPVRCAEECDYLRLKAEKRLERSGVVDTATGASKLSDIRTRCAVPGRGAQMQPPCCWGPGSSLMLCSCFCACHMHELAVTACSSPALRTTSLRVRVRRRRAVTARHRGKSTLPVGRHPDVCGGARVICVGQWPTPQ